MLDTAFVLAESGPGQTVVVPASGESALRLVVTAGHRAPDG
ncbi:hypothetical protein [Nonomuraea endophytica]|uniref:Uncharacterized protein n=1 Tax=Nonomuraea endophytica TaxID=714136 RepID=A0A7W8AEQ7_9ACTN|nr:hypothetical protein [Nonomuraea endophytica]MBB5084765.1 hypothetical protein [Nonomuraea endophytica]